MATESLIVELDARTKKLDEKLKATDEKLNGLADSSKKTQGSLGKLSAVGGAVAKGLGVTANVAKKAAASFLAIKAAVVATTAVAAAYAKDIGNVADLMGVSAEEAQAWSSATQTVGIDLEKLGDISKDTSEKIGQFLTMGGGGFEDFGDAMGFTKEQTLEAAKELQGLSGTDVLQSMVTQMEAAGVSSEKMSFALEGMASDTTKLLPLMTNAGEGAKRLKDNFYEAAVVLSSTDISKLEELSGSFQNLSETFKGTMGKFSVEYADQINSIIESTQEGLKIVGDEFASGSLTDRLNSFYDAFTDSWAVVFGDNISVFDEFSVDAEGIINSLAAEWLDYVTTMPINLAIAGHKVKEVFADILDEIKIAMAEANLLVQQGLDLIGEGDVSGAQSALDAITAETDARDAAHDKEIERLRTEKEAILEKFHAEQEAATVKREQYATDSAERMKIDDAEAEASRKRVKGVSSVSIKVSKADKDADDKLTKGKATNIKNFASVAGVANNLMFEDNKAIKAGIIVADTAAAVMNQMAGGDPVTAFGRATAAAAMGVAQLANLQSATKGGGSVSASESGSTQATQEQNFQQETSSLELSDASETGSRVLNIQVPDGDEIGMAIAKWMNQAQAEGRV